MSNNDSTQRVTGTSDLLARYAAGERDFRGANLSGANLWGADLWGANLAGANLWGADLWGANLAGANLWRADLVGADLAGADLTDADLTDADLVGANLSGAVLTIEQLRVASLAAIRGDVLALCRLMPAEVPGLLAALDAGQINGSVYRGECACLVGTLAHCRGVDVDALPALVPGLTIDSETPRERWFLAIRQGDTPETSPVAAITAEWLRELLAELGETDEGE